MLFRGLKFPHIKMWTFKSPTLRATVVNSEALLSFQCLNSGIVCCYTFLCVGGDNNFLCCYTLKCLNE